MNEVLANLSAMVMRRWAELWDSVIDPKPDVAGRRAIVVGAADHAPVIWLLGKVQSGKTSIVRALTGASSAEIGEGFRACTRTASLYDFPAEAPVVRFLDTRGLGEARYDPTADLAELEGRAHLVMAVMRAMDPGQAPVITALFEVRRRHPDWPVVVAQTCLHEGYPASMHHPLPYPFDTDESRSIPEALRRALAYQRALLDGLPGHGAVTFVPIDFTRPEDGLKPADYGIEALHAALLAAAPAGLTARIEYLRTAGGGTSQRAQAHIMGYAIAAAAADLVPVAGAIAVPGIQAKLLHSLAGIHGARWDRRTVAEFSACLGTGTVVRLLGTFGARELAKLIPVYGQTAGAAAAAGASFVTTYALGKAACYFIERRRLGPVDAEGVVGAYRAALAEALRLSRQDQALPGGGTTEARP